MRIRVVLALSVVTIGLAFSGRARAADEYSFSWLDPEKKIYVLQNRKFLKSLRPFFSVMGGTGLSNPYRTAINADGRAAFYLSESWGVELFYAMGFNSINGTARALPAGVNPIVREVSSRYGALVQWVPWYAKINVFNVILHFDWYVNAGAGQVAINANSSTSGTTFATQNALAIFAGTGHLYHLNRWLSIRLDLSGTFFPSRTFVDTGNTEWYSNYDLGAGLVLKLL
jgi:outer membrane beta-barrel protein